MVEKMNISNTYVLPNQILKITLENNSGLLYTSCSPNPFHFHPEDTERLHFPVSFALRYGPLTEF